jgi:hypothetical protein
MADLENAVRRYNKVVSTNNILAAKNPRYAARIAALRSDGMNQQAMAAYYKARGGLGNVAVVGSVTAVAVVAAISVLFYVIRREEQQLAQESPLQYAMTQASFLTTVALVVGGLGLFGIIYLEAKEPGTIPFLGGTKKKSSSQRKRQDRDVDRELDRLKYQEDLREREKRARQEGLRRGMTLFDE